MSGPSRSMLSPMGLTPRVGVVFFMTLFVSSRLLYVVCWSTVRKKVWILLRNKQRLSKREDVCAILHTDRFDMHTEYT
mgnify:CR=1 FL=1